MRDLTYRRITEEDLKDAPGGSWKSKLLYAINLFFQQMYYGLQNQLTPEENDICETKTFQIIGSSVAANNTFNFTTKYTYRPRQAVMGRIVPTDGSSLVFTTAPFLSWDFNNGTFMVLGICGLSDGVPYSVSVEIRWPPIVN